MGTLLFEGIGAALLSIRFIPRFGPVKGIYFAIFHSVSAFCNAGFDLMGEQGPYSSFVDYVGDPLVNLVLIALIVIGGLGFIVWNDVSSKHFHWKQFSLNTKLVLSVTALLIGGGTLFLFLFEQGNTLEGLSTGEQLLTSLFGSVTASNCV